MNQLWNNIIGKVEINDLESKDYAALSTKRGEQGHSEAHNLTKQQIPQISEEPENSDKQII